MGSHVPDFRGLFLRGFGEQAHTQINGSTVGQTTTVHKSGALGEVQGDAMRNITGSFFEKKRGSFKQFIGETVDATGVFEFKDEEITVAIGESNYFSSSVPKILELNTSRVVPTAGENRPVNVAVRYLIRARP